MAENDENEGAALEGRVAQLDPAEELVHTEELRAEERNRAAEPDGAEASGAAEEPDRAEGSDGAEKRDGGEESDRAEERDGADPSDGAADKAAASQDVAELPETGAEPAGDGDEEDDHAPRRGSAELKAILEALIFASPDPLTPKAIYKLLDNEPKEDVLAALVELKEDYQRPGGLQLVEVAGGLQIVTRPDLHEWVRRLFHERSSQKLSVQALETLAVIAYRQPVTAAEITDIRGVNTSGVLNTLLERHLIKIAGRKQVVGRPFMYSTTKEFLIRFGLNDLTDLPKVADMAEALGIEGPLLVEQSPSEELLPLEEPEADGDATAGPGGERDARETVDAPGEPDDPHEADDRSELGDPNEPEGPVR